MHKITILLLALSMTSCGDYSRRWDIRYQAFPGISEYKNSIKYKNNIIDLAGLIDWTMYSVFSDRLFELREREPSPAITVLINTPGGMVGAAKGIIQTLNASKLKYRLIVVQSCGSAAFEILLQAKGPVFALKGSEFFVHSYNDPEYYQKQESEYQKKFKLPKEWYPLKESVYREFTVEEALNYGVIDSILEDESSIFKVYLPNE